MAEAQSIKNGRENFWWGPAGGVVGGLVGSLAISVLENPSRRGRYRWGFGLEEIILGGVFGITTVATNLLFRKVSDFINSNKEGNDLPLALQAAIAIPLQLVVTSVSLLLFGMAVAYNRRQPFGANLRDSFRSIMDERANFALISVAWGAGMLVGSDLGRWVEKK
ncbi:MAG: hypothetical protein HYW02_08300 [Deltaproteobacteria bacterium]|nr:hypothetical protein [Deltaproteobacteria bacterium]MBI2501436.1 hypothetical protein [Deltaproteobacteria bacterium]